MVSTPIAGTTDGAWHGAIPDGWSLKQLKWAITFQRGHDLPTENRQKGHVPVFTGGGITGWHNVAQARGPGIVTGRYGTIGEFYLVEQDYWPLNTSLYSIDMRGNHAGFLRYMLEPLAPLFHLNAAKSAVPGIDRADIHTIPVAVPPLAIQRAIAAYLDQETARLDGLVAVKERMLALLEEKWAALVSRAVTQSLQPDVPLKPSGIAWLGEIPAHWDVKRLKWLISSLTQGWSPQASNLPASQGEMGVLKLSAVSHGVFIPHENKALSVDDKNPAELALQSGDVLVTRSNTPELVGDACIVPSNFPSLLIPDLIYRLRLRRDLIEPEYLSSFLITPAARTQIRRDARGSSGSMVKVSQEHLLNWLIPVPPPIEQRAILEYLARERTRTAELEDALHRSIALLKERRSALITAAVTGQLAPEAMSA